MARVMFDVLELNIVVTIIILILCAFAEKLRKRYGARWLKLVWVLLAFRLLIPYNFSLPFTEIRLFNVPGFAQEEVVEDTGSMPIVESELLQGVVGEDDLATENGMAAEPQQGTTPEALGEKIESVGTDVGAAPNQYVIVEPLPEPGLGIRPDSQQMDGDNAVMKTEQEQGYEVAGGQTKGSLNDFTYTNILLTIWLVGVAFFAIYYISIYTSFQHKCKKNMVLLGDGELLEQVNSLQVDFLGKVYVNAYQSELASTPMLVGFLVPKLVLPTNVKEWQQEELRMVVLHELCHYQQKDLWLKWIVLAGHCLNWFNPALVLMKKQCFYDIELVCDMTVLEDCGLEERELYARTMLSFAKREKQTAAFSTNFSVSKKDLKNRINSMFDVSKKKRGLAAFLFVGALLMGMSLLISCGYKPEEQPAESIETGQEAIGNSSENEDGTQLENSNDKEDESADNQGEITLPAPTKEEVLAMRARALEGMSEQEIDRLKENIKVANQRMEKAYFYDDLFGKLSDPEHLYWNYFDQKEDIQIGWETDGTPKMVYNRFDADNFVVLMEEMRDSLKSDLLKQDFDKLIECTKLAKENHEVEYVEQIYRILHDMDYFLLRYGIEDVGKYLDDLSAVSKYYGVLEIYTREDIPEDMTSAIAKILIQLISKEEAQVAPEITQYSFEEAMEIGEVVALKGGLPGLGEGTWYIVTIDGVEHFYAKYDSEEVVDYYGYAIISEDYELECGIKVGMNREEILAKYPYTRIEDFAGNCLSDSLAPEYVCWNGGAYPRSAQGTDPNFEYNGRDYSWWNQFDYVMMLDIDLGTYDTLPIYLGLLMKDEKVKAITFYYPTAG